MADVFGSRLSADEGKGAARLEDAFVNFGQRVEALFSGGSFELGGGDQFSFQPVRFDLSAFDQDIRLALHDLFQPVVAVEKTHYEIVDDQQGGGADDAAGDAVVVADDGVLHSVRKGEQDNEVEWIELHEFTLAGEPEAHDQKRVDEDRAKNFLQQGETKDEHIFPNVVGWQIASSYAGG